VVTARDGSYVSARSCTAASSPTRDATHAILKAIRVSSDSRRDTTHLFAMDPSIIGVTKRRKSLLQRLPTIQLPSSISTIDGREGSDSHVVAPASKATSKRATRMLLLLNQSTFTGAGGKILAAEVRLAMQNGIQIVMVHEVDPARDGCDFSRFFKTTPQDLIDAGLYKSLAIAAHREPYRPASLALLCKALGATKRRRLTCWPWHAKTPSHKTMVTAAEQSVGAAQTTDRQISLEAVHSSPEPIHMQQWSWRQSIHSKDSASRGTRRIR
jgi:hypothetical protein